jgi:glutamate synthase domain-containing protein 3
MAKNKVKVKLLASLSGSDGNFAPGDDYDCSRDEAIRHYLKGHCEPITGKEQAKFIKDAEALQEKTGFGLPVHERLAWQTENEANEADDKEFD